jgi:hypothetical protein
MPWLSSVPGFALRKSAGRNDGQHAVRQKTSLIQKAMLECLDGDVSQPARAVARRIHLASDAAGLWQLRGDVMTALALRHGEALARQQVASFTPLFREVLPEGSASQSFGAFHHPFQRGEPT